MRRRTTPVTPQERRASKPTGRYRKVEVRTWGDEKFRALSPIPPCGQGLWLYIITGPHTGPIPGLFRASRAAMAEELGWSLEAFGEAFGEAFQQGMVEADFGAHVMWVPNAIRHNKPESPNVVRSWAAEFDLVPECDLKRTAFDALKASIHALGEAFGKAFDESFSKPSPKPSAKPSPKPSGKAMANQEQEQEQEYSEAKASAPAAPLPPILPPISPPLKASETVKPMTAKERVWAIGVGVFGEDQSARKRIGKLAGTYGDEVLAEVLAQAVLEKPAEPMSWVTAACEARKLERPKTNGHDSPHQVDMLADPTPKWALDAGFRNRFEAENEGCKPGNASAFRQGKRVAP